MAPVRLRARFRFAGRRFRAALSNVADGISSGSAIRMNRCSLSWRQRVGVSEVVAASSTSPTVEPAYRSPPPARARASSCFSRAISAVSA